MIFKISACKFNSRKLKFLHLTPDLCNKPFQYLDEKVTSTVPRVINILAPITIRILSPINSYDQIHHVLATIHDGICRRFK